MNRQELINEAKDFGVSNNDIELLVDSYLLIIKTKPQFKFMEMLEQYTRVSLEDASKIKNYEQRVLLFADALGFSEYSSKPENYSLIPLGFNTPPLGAV